MTEQKKLTSKELLNQLVAKHYDDALTAKAEGRPVVWATSISPQELLETMDLTVVYPENHAAAIGARKGSMEFISYSEGKGYSSDLCSYARVNMGYVDLKDAEAQNIPQPDLILCCNNICNTVIKWYENIAKELHIPMILFDTPYSYEYQISEESIQYMRRQFDYAIRQLEELTKKRFDYDRLSEVMEVSNSTCRWWKKSTELAMHKPSPLSGFDMFNYMAMVVCMRGNKDGETLFRLWYEELEERMKQNLGPWNNAEEKYRIMWDGIACWPHLATTFKTLKKYGVNMVASTYPDSWNIRYEKNDLDALVRAYASHYANRSIAYSVDNIAKIAEDYSLDGIIFHSNRSCKLMDFKQYEIQRQVQQRTGVPAVFFDGDQTDPRVFSDAQYETRIQALVELMEKNK
ncbi:MAG: 2-hydroxyacyl-CoA dehydratase subunit D [Clostridia bacterium]